MFAARLVARSAPRFSARSIATVARRSVAAPLAIKSQLPSTTFKYFSTTRSQFDSSSQELAAKIQSEFQLESESADGVDGTTGIKESLEAAGWEVKDTEGEQAVKLYRKHDDELIEVQFTLADFPSPFNEDEEFDDDALLDEEDMDVQSGGGNSKAAHSQGRTSGGNIKMGQDGDVAPGSRDELRDQEDEHSVGNFPASVTVTVTRSGKEGVLHFDLVAEDGGFTVQAVTPLPNAEAISATGFNGAEKHYIGPAFAQLDDELQSIFVNYLEARGINDQLASSVPDYIDAKEQKEYLTWLTKVGKLVE